MIKYLIDENLQPLYKVQLKQYFPELIVLMIGEPTAPPKGTLDPDVLLWCERNGFILVTNNRSSMPVHLIEHTSKNHKIPGIFVLRKKSTFGEIIHDLILIAKVGELPDYQNRITHVPL